MKRKLFWGLGLSVLALLGYGGWKAYDYNRFDSDTRVIAIGYHSDNCRECLGLRKRMRAMNRQFGWDDIVFVRYDHTDSTRKARSEAQLAKLGFLDIAQRDYKRLAQVRLYSVRTQKFITYIDFDYFPQVMADRIRLALDLTAKGEF